MAMVEDKWTQDNRQMDTGQAGQSKLDQIRSVAQSCPTLCNPMNCSRPGLPVYHQLPEFTQTHDYRVSDAIQPSHPLSSPSPPAPNPSQQQKHLKRRHDWVWKGNRSRKLKILNTKPRILSFLVFYSAKDIAWGVWVPFWLSDMNMNTLFLDYVYLNQWQAQRNPCMLTGSYTLCIFWFVVWHLLIPLNFLSTLWYTEKSM